MAEKLYYNKELKERFLENYNKETAKTYRFDLVRISDAENRKGKDCFNFTYEELDDAFKALECKTLASARSSVAAISEYIAWANQKGFVKTKIDISELINGDKIKDYVWKHAQEESLINRDRLHAICDSLVNPIDAAIPALFFEGVEHTEIIYLKKRDIDFDSGKISLTDGREIIINDKIILNILKEASKQTEYTPNNGDITEKTKRARIHLCDTPYLIRTIQRREIVHESYDEANNVRELFISSKAVKFFKGVIDKDGNMTKQPFVSDAYFLNFNNIFKSGYCDYCFELEKEKGELTTDDFKRTCVRFGMKEDRWQAYKENYFEWKKKYGDEEM